MYRLSNKNIAHKKKGVLVITGIAFLLTSLFMIHSYTIAGTSRTVSSMNNLDEVTRETKYFPMYPVVAKLHKVTSKKDNGNIARIGYFQGGRVSIIYRTHINGFFSQEGITVKLYTGSLKDKELIKLPETHEEYNELSKSKLLLGKIRGTTIVDLMMEGIVDAGTIGESSFILKINQGAPIVAVALLGYFNTPGKAIMVRKDVEINTPSDFKGRTLISRRAGPGDAIFLREFIEDIGLTPEDLNIIDQVDEDDSINWLKQGRIDGGLYHLMQVKSLVERDIAYIYRPMDWMDSALSQAVLVFNRDYVKNHPKKVQKVVSAYMKRIAYENNLPEDEIDKSWSPGLTMKGTFQGMQLPQYDFPPKIRMDQLNEIQDLLFKYGYIDKKIEIKEFIDNRFVEIAYNKLRTFPSLKGFNLTKNHIEHENTRLLRYTDGHNTIRLKIIPNLNKTSSEEIMSISAATLESIYDTTASAYPGMISNEIVCDSRFIPEQKSLDYNGREITYFIVHLSERLSYGACTDDLTPNKGIIAWSYCKVKKELRQFEFISPKASFHDSSLEFIKKNICN